MIRLVKNPKTLYRFFNEIYCYLLRLLIFLGRPKQVYFTGVFFESCALLLLHVYCLPSYLISLLKPHLFFLKIDVPGNTRSTDKDDDIYIFILSYIGKQCYFNPRAFP